MNVVLLVVDSLRADAVTGAGAARPATPFLDRLARETVWFRRAHAAECWTLPSHMSMFTGLLPSQHGAHFRHLGYAGTAPTIAELLAAEGFHTEIVTRNSIFDGSLPGVTRGFAANTLVLSPRSTGLNPLSLLLALSKPRFRRQILGSGFFHPRQRQSLRFLTTFARATLPADVEALQHVLDRMADCRRRGRRYFIFCNLYDVHAPYAPAPGSIFRAPTSLAGLEDSLRMPFVLPRLGGHAYLRTGFRLSARSRRMLRARYDDAVRLMDAKLADFHRQARAAGLLDDTVLVITSDHGEAFGEHGLYLHDASVYQTHLHVPLFVHHPDRAPAAVDDVVSTRHLFGLLLSAALDRGRRATILDPAYRAAHPIALAEHLHYPHVANAEARFRQDLVAAVGSMGKVVVQNGGPLHFDLTSDPAEDHPRPTRLADLGRACLGAAALAAAAEAEMGRAVRRLTEPRVAA